jgi:hypothetical protein
MAKVQLSKDEARLEILNYLARAIWCFFMEEGADIESNTEDLEISQGMALLITDSMKMEVLEIENDVFTIKIDLSDDPIPFIFGLEKDE